jgi:hypothetical protein
MRLFVPKANNGWKCELVGQQTYMGQTSLGIGLGCEGDWAYGVGPKRIGWMRILTFEADGGDSWGWRPGL